MLRWSKKMVQQGLRSTSVDCCIPCKARCAIGLLPQLRTEARLAPQMDCKQYSAISVNDLPGNPNAHPLPGAHPTPAAQAQKTPQNSAAAPRACLVVNILTRPTLSGYVQGTGDREQRSGCMAEGTPGDTKTVVAGGADDDARETVVARGAPHP